MRALGVQHKKIACMQLHLLVIHIQPAAALQNVQKLGKNMAVKVTAGGGAAVMDAGVQQLHRGKLVRLFGLNVKVMGDHGPQFAPSGPGKRRTPKRAARATTVRFATLSMKGGNVFVKTKNEKNWKIWRWRIKY